MIGRLSTFGLRRGLAIMICPELLVARPAVGSPADGRVEQVIRLGEVFLEHAGTEDFAAAAGAAGRRSRAYLEAKIQQRRWRAFVQRPPQRMRSENYDRHVRWFSANWPEGEEWPGDIERPVIEADGDNIIKAEDAA